MGKTEVFMVITAIISVLCFNFNKFLNYILTMVSDNMYDESVLVYGPYMKSKPVVVDRVLIDEEVFTNKMCLLLNWKWNFDISGITLSDIRILKQDATVMVLYYKKKHENSDKSYGIEIDFVDNTVTKINTPGDTVEKNTVRILFEEVRLI
jgi:hypothetical protein